jgi:hypothetical protein
MELKSDIDDRALKYIQDTKPNIPILPMIHRWAFGTLQCLWKHRELTLRPRYGALGMIAVPQISLFQLLLTVLAPLVDFALIWQLAVSALKLLEHQDQFDGDALRQTCLYYLAFLVVDLGSAALAFALERREKWSLVPWLVLQRFGYRQLICTASF